jgi:hypothetical protein
MQQTQDSSVYDCPLHSMKVFVEKGYSPLIWHLTRRRHDLLSFKIVLHSAASSGGSSCLAGTGAMIAQVKRDSPNRRHLHVKRHALVSAHSVSYLPRAATRCFRRGCSTEEWVLCVCIRIDRGQTQ